ncbi:patched domain-containing protein 3-like [Centruroides vittatus]|uniref:patched domain-containing protein 3-like n=1 Tax=Centruroides vittatus TaxID=120091 RepID=UPI00350EE434
MPRCNVCQILSKKFEELGKRISREVTWFITVPLMTTVFLATGIQRLNFDFTDDLYIPRGSVINRYQLQLEKIFPANYSDFEPSRLLQVGNYASVIVLAADGRSIFRQNIFNEIVQLDAKIRNISVYVDEELWHYRDLCSTESGECFENKITSIGDRIKLVENGTLYPKYPSERNKTIENALSLGGVNVDRNSNIVSAKALRLIYFLSKKNKRHALIAKAWEEKFIKTIGETKFKNIKVERDASISKEQLKKENIFVGFKHISPASILICIFTIATCSFPDLRKSKPWTGILSLIATVMSVVSGFGALIYIGTAMSTITIIVPFLILGIGIDDTFILLSAWRKTDTSKSVEWRMGEALSECGVSVTITSFTNIASFVVGALITSLPVHGVFCIYMATCLVFDYVYQITFIVAVMALWGRAEEKNLNSFIFTPLDSNSDSEKTCTRKYLCCVGKKDFSNLSASLISCNKYWKLLLQSMTNYKVLSVIIFSYLVYLSIAAWGFTQLSFRATFNMGLLYNSYQYSYFKAYQDNFYQYQYRLQIFIMQELDYADPEIQTKIENITRSIESDPLISGSLFTESWLRTYLEFINHRNVVPVLRSFNLTDSKDFLLILRKFFFSRPAARRFGKDVVFDRNYTKIVASRFLFQTNITRNGNQFYDRVKNLRKTLEKSEYRTILYHPLFYYFDILDVIPVTVVQTLTSISVVVFVTSAIFLSDVLSILCVLSTILSVMFGVIGYMSLWDVSFGIMSISILVMVCGFSVDYAAHVVCAYGSSKETDPKKRLITAVSLTGMPILQSSITTILVVIVFVTRPSLEFFVCMKIIVLASLISAIHGIVFVTVMICVLNCIWNYVFLRKSVDFVT